MLTRKITHLIFMTRECLPVSLHINDDVLVYHIGKILHVRPAYQYRVVGWTAVCTANVRMVHWDCVHADKKISGMIDIYNDVMTWIDSRGGDIVIWNEGFGLGLLLLKHPGKKSYTYAGVENFYILFLFQRAQLDG